MDANKLEALLRLPPSTRAAGVPAATTHDGSLADSAFRVQMRGSPIPRPEPGAYKTCSAAAHSQQVQRWLRGTASLLDSRVNVAIMLAGKHPIFPGSTWIDRRCP